MKKTTKKLSIHGETIRKLGDHDLAKINGGYTTYIYCEPTQFYGCVPKTPNCPM